MKLNELTLVAAADGIREGRFTSAELVSACLARIDAREPEVQAWAFLDPAHAMRQAEAADLYRMSGKQIGPLHGVPIGVKDVFDTGDMPTELGSPLWTGRTPRRDAVGVARLRAAGAVILGKTVTTEYAYLHPAKTRNPLDPQRTPGGSSSGSAAAVADLMVPGAIGSQTNGSVIRPAAFCGVVGYKPTHGLIARSGALLLSRTLDHVGVFARTIEDAGLLAEQLLGFDEEDPDTRPLAHQPLRATAVSEPPLPPRCALVRTAAWGLAEPATVAAFEELATALGDAIEIVEIGARFDRSVEQLAIIMEVEMAHNLHRDYEKGREQLSPALRAKIEKGRARSAVEYLAAKAAITPLNQALDHVFDEFDAIITPAAGGEAPSLETTGDPAFCSTWTLLGTPALTLPLLQSQHGLPLGVQLIGRRGDDARLLRTARWFAGRLATASATRSRPRREEKTGSRRSRRQA